MTWRDFLFFYFCWNVEILYLPKPGSTSAVKNNLNSSYACVSLLGLLDRCSDEWQESGGRERQVGFKPGLAAPSNTVYDHLYQKKQKKNISKC